MSQWIGGMIRQARRTQGWSQQRLADLVGVSVRSVWAYEHGDHQPRAEVLLALSRVLHLNPEVFGRPHSPTGLSEKSSSSRKEEDAE